jgi:hypothetical protein
MDLILSKLAKNAKSQGNSIRFSELRKTKKDFKTCLG